jgi:hypothetical protein
VASANLPLRITEESVNDRIYFLSNFRASAQGSPAAYIRALESLAQGDRDKTKEYLTLALDQKPANNLAGQLLVGLYFANHKYDSVAALFERMGIDTFRTAPESLAQISISLWQAGKATQARQVIQTARSLFPRDPVIASTEKSLQRLLH